MKLFNLAWRNVFRHTRRSIITGLAISIGLGAMIYLDTMMNGVDKMASKNIIDYETGHLQIFARGYYKEERFYSLDTIIENPEFVVERLQNIKGISGFAQRIKFQCRINNGIDELPVVGIGIEPEQEKGIFEIEKAVVMGSFLKKPDALLIGASLAKELNLEPGSNIMVIVRDRNGTYNAIDFVVAGLLDTGHPLFDRNSIIISLENARQLLAIPGACTEICVRLKDEHRMNILKNIISQSLGQYFEVFTYKEVNASIFEISGMKRSIQFLLALVVVIIAAVGIINTMLMAVMERTQEIGTLKAMGFSNQNIIKMFLYEGGIIGIFGSIVGCILGLIFSLHLSIVGLDMSKAFGNMDIGYPIKMVIKGEISYQTIFSVFVFGIIISMLVTLLPVRRAVRLEPVEALRHV